MTKWRASELEERYATQSHVIDLCRMPGEPTPTDADPAGKTLPFSYSRLDRRSQTPQRRVSALSIAFA